MKAQYDKKTGLPYGVEDLSMRLGGTVVRYRERPVLVTDVADRSMILLDLVERNEYRVRLPDQSLNVRPVPLGYLNTPQGAVYASRTPARRYKQGLSPDGLKLRPSRHGNRDMLSSPYLGRCILNMYPDFDEAYDSVKRGGVSVAFSRRFALSKDKSGVVFIEYRGDRVGWWSGKLELGDTNEYLREELEAVYEGA